VAKMKSDIDKLLADIGKITNQISELSKVPEGITRLVGQVEKAVHNLGAFRKAIVFDRLDVVAEQISKWKARADSIAVVIEETSLLLPAALPKRGWYLSGNEDMSLWITLADAIRREDWETVDKEIMSQLPEFDLARLAPWLDDAGVADHTKYRLLCFMSHHKDGNFEEATYMGVPLIDELAMFFYDGKSLTTKRGNRRRPDHLKPELGYKTPTGPTLNEDAGLFVQTFGSLQEDPDPARLSDEDYWNRHAIVHGMMRRRMGAMDSAKCLMAISFLLFGGNDTERENAGA